MGRGLMSLICATLILIPVAQGYADPGAGGSVTGVQPQKVICLNVTTKQKVTIRNSATSWDCTAAGLVVNPGNTIKQTVTGTAINQTALFSDDFSNGYPGTKWVTVTGAPTIDATSGNPAPSLQLDSSPGGPDRARTNVNPFSPSGGITISVQVAIPASPPGGNAIFQIRDQADVNIGGFVQVSATQALYDISNSFGNDSSISNPFTPDTNFHTFTFAVDSGGTTRWFRDGIQQLSKPGFPSTAQLIFDLGVTGGTVGPYHFDNALVTKP